MFAIIVFSDCMVTQAGLEPNITRIKSPVFYQLNYCDISFMAGFVTGKGGNQWWQRTRRER